MLPSSLSLETISRGLFLQQMNQDVIASNLAQPYQDSQGYLINSLERVNSASGTSLLFGDPLGQMAVGTGPIVSQITRLRNLFLDTQIQQASSVLGKSEILTSTLSQINGIINGASGTLDQALTKFAADWAALGASANPGTDVADRSAVVADGVAFADLANSQYTQLENMQRSYSDQITQSVSNINQMLQQLSSLNKQLLASPAGVNTNNLLDARDYTLDLLSRQINIQTNFGTAGTVSVFLGGSNISLVNGAGASILQTNVMNVHNPGLVNVTVQSSEGTVTVLDPTQWISGGDLGGLLQARDVTLEGYKDQIDQIASSVINVTNMLHEAGYDSTGTVTGNDFFTGTGAENISVNGSIVADKTYGLVAASLVPSTDPNYLVENGVIAQYLGNLPNLLANNFVASGNNINGAGVIDPTLPINGQPIALPPSGGNFTVNGNTVNILPTDSIDDILAKINAADPNVYAVFNSKLQEFYMVSNNPVLIVDQPPGAGSFTYWGVITNYLTSTITMNNDFTGTNPLFDPNAPLNSLTPAAAPTFNTGPNSQAFRVIPGTGGVFTINGVTFPAWNNTMSLNQISFLFGPLLPGTGLGFGITNPPGPYAGGTYAPGFGPETVFLASSQAPIPLQIVDTTGNFTDFTGLNATNNPIGSLSSGVLGQIQNDISAQGLIQGQASSALDQLNTAQANIAGVSMTEGQPGVPIATLQEQAVQSLVAYNASLDVLQVIDQMYEDLVGIVGGTTTSNSIFQHR